MSVRRRIVGAISILTIAVTIAACTPKLSAMPILLSRGPDGWPIVSVPVCAGDRVTFAAVFVPSGTGEVEHHEKTNGSSADRLLEFNLSRDSIQAGSISNDVPATQVIPYAKVPDKLAELGRFRVTTGRYRAAVDFDAAWTDSSGPLLVFGVEGADDDAYLKSVTAAAGQEVIQRWCQDKR